MIPTATKRFFSNKKNVVGTVVSSGLFSMMTGDTLKGFLTSVAICAVLSIGIEVIIIEGEKQ